MAVNLERVLSHLLSGCLTVQRPVSHGLGERAAECAEGTAWMLAFYWLSSATKASQEGRGAGIACSGQHSLSRETSYPTFLWGLFGVECAWVIPLGTPQPPPCVLI